MLDFIIWGPSAPNNSTLLLRLAMGVFFASSGFHKLFVPEVRTKFLGLMTSLGQNTPVKRWLIPGAEFMGGLALIIGFLTLPAALGLIIILLGAICLDCWAEVEAKHPRDAFDWFAKAVYMPEGLMVIVLVSIILTGPGMISADALIDQVL